MLLLGLGLALTMALASPASAQVIDEEDRPAEDQITRLYQAVFGRDADEEGFAFWVDLYRNGGSLSAIATQFVGSDEFIERYGANPTDDAMIDAVYQNVLGRDGDVGGVNFWRDQLDSAAVTQLGLLLAFTDSPENIERTNTSEPLSAREAQLLRLYRSAFGRFPDAGGFAFWMGEYTETTPLRDIALRFSQSPEFTDIYGTSPRPGELVDRLYMNVLGREGEASGVGFWESEYLAGRSIPEMLTAFADSPENMVRTGTVVNTNAAPALPESIRRPRVENMTLPLGTCGITELTGTQMVDGATQMDEFGAEISIVDGDIAFADLNGDGATDAVVALTCFGGGNAIWSDAVVWLAGTTPEKLAFNLYGVLDVRGIDSIATTRTTSDVAPGIVEIAWAGELLSDPACCPSASLITEVTASGQQVIVTDTFVDGIELNAIRFMTAASEGGDRPADLPVSDAIWDDAVEWLDGSTATFSGMPCSRAQDDGTTALCLFFAPDALEVSDILLELDKTEDDEVWTITEFSPILD